MTTRNKRSAYFLAPGIVLIAAGAALGSTPSIFVGVMIVALAIRYRKNPVVWEYLCFVALLLAELAWFISTDSQPSPLVVAIPLMLSYVFDYLDERRQERAPTAEATVPGGASHGGRLAEPALPRMAVPGRHEPSPEDSDKPPSVG